MLVAVHGIFSLHVACGFLLYMESSSLMRDWNPGPLYWEHGVLAIGLPERTWGVHLSTINIQRGFPQTILN